MRATAFSAYSLTFSISTNLVPSSPFLLTPAPPTIGNILLTIDPNVPIYYILVNFYDNYDMLYSYIYIQLLVPAIWKA